MADGDADAAVPAPSGRYTALHWAAYNGSISAGAELLVGGADQRITNSQGYRRAAHKPRRRAAHADRCRKTPRQLAQANNKLGEYDAAVAQARPPHRRRRIARSSRMRAARRRRHRHARQACTRAARHAEAAFFGVRSRTRGMTCASHCARSFAAVGRQKVLRAHTALPPTVRRAQRMLPSRAHSSRHTASLASCPLSHQSAMALQAEQLRAAKAEVRPLRPPATASARIHDTSVAAEVLIARMRALSSLRSNSIVERLPPTPTARRKIDFFRVCGGRTLASQMSQGACHAPHAACCCFAACRVAVP